MKEQETKRLHSVSRLIAAIASEDFDNEEWPELLPALFSLAGNNNRTQREVGSYIIYSSLESNPLMYNDHIHKLLEAFSHMIKDPESADVRINTMMSVGALLVLIDADEDEKAVKILQGLVPSMGLILKDAIDQGDSEKVKQAFEVLQQFLAYESSFLGSHLKSLLQFMIDLAANTESDEDVRTQSLAFLTQAVHFRRMKIQALPDMSKQFVVKSLQILTEIEDDEDDDEITPGRSALALLDALASDHPPRQVIVPQLDEFPKYSSSPDPTHRKAGILALGTCAEGAPDFVMTQLPMITPILIRLLNDPDETVRHCALIGLTGLAEEMAEELAPEHEALVTALSKNLQAAMVETADEKAAKKNASVIRTACTAFDALSQGLKAEVMNQYAHQLIGPIGSLLSHEDAKIKIAAASALGAIAGSLGEDFGPYFEKTMTALGVYINIKETEDDLALRSGICDAMGRIAVAVGPKMFQPYVVDLMRTSEEGLPLENERLRESSFILWSSLSRGGGGGGGPGRPGGGGGRGGARE